MLDVAWVVEVGRLVEVGWAVEVARWLDDVGWDVLELAWRVVEAA